MIKMPIKREPQNRRGAWHRGAIRADEVIE